MIGDDGRANYRRPVGVVLDELERDLTGARRKRSSP